MRRIFISAGHGAGDPGAVGFGRTEAAVVLEFRDLVGYYLSVAGAPYAMDGPKGTNYPLRDAVKLVRAGDVAVEFHLNAAAAPTATGVETLGGSNTLRMCEKLCKTIATRLNIRNRGAKPENSGQHSRLAFVQAGGAIVELFFISNKSDLDAYDNTKWLLAREVADILIEEAKK